MDLAQFAQAYHDAEQLISASKAPSSAEYEAARKFVTQVKRPGTVVGMGVALALDLAMGKHNDIKLANIIVYPVGDTFQIVPIDHEFACESKSTLYDTKDLAASKIPQVASTLMKHVNDYTRIIDNGLSPEVLSTIRPIFELSVIHDLENKRIAQAYNATAQIPSNQILHIEETTNGIYNSKEHRLFQERMLDRQNKIQIHSFEEKRGHVAKLEGEQEGAARGGR